jgi:hypothetical protein
MSKIVRNDMATRGFNRHMYVWFEETTEGSTIGMCPRCHAAGAAGSICHRCSVIPMPTHVWFETTEGDLEGVEMGTCPLCLGRGEVHQVCGRCSNLPLGLCPGCYEEGKVGVMCADCNLQFAEEAPDGECFNCKETGTRGTLCNNCEDTGFVFE